MKLNKYIKASTRTSCPPGIPGNAGYYGIVVDFPSGFEYQYSLAVRYTRYIAEYSMNVLKTITGLNEQGARAKLARRRRRYPMLSHQSKFDIKTGKLSVVSNDPMLEAELLLHKAGYMVSNPR